MTIYDFPYTLDRKTQSCDHADMTTLASYAHNDIAVNVLFRDLFFFFALYYLHPSVKLEEFAFLKKKNIYNPK